MSNVKALPKTVEVTLGEEKIVVKKLPLGKYAQLMFTLQNMPKGVVKEFQNIKTEDGQATAQAIFGIFGQAWGQVLDILAIGSGIDKERIENDETIGLDGGVELFLAIWEVNNLEGVFNSVKNGFNRPKK
jgi:hypothetical protein